jgi:hypothetical protein
MDERVCHARKIIEKFLRRDCFQPQIKHRWNTDFWTQSYGQRNRLGKPNGVEFKAAEGRRTPKRERLPTTHRLRVAALGREPPSEKLRRRTVLY